MPSRKFFTNWKSRGSWGYLTSKQEQMSNFSTNMVTFHIFGHISGSNQRILMQFFCFKDFCALFRRKKHFLGDLGCFFWQKIAVRRQIQPTEKHTDKQTHRQKQIKRQRQTQ